MVVIQSLIIVALALIVGASFPGGVGGVALLFVLSALLGAMFGALSNGFALIMGQEEALIGATQFILLPLTFLSTTFLAANIMPGWIAHVADFNPVNWAVVAGRSAVSSSADWGLIAARAGFLVALLALSVAFATRRSGRISGRFMLGRASPASVGPVPPGNGAMPFGSTT